MRAGLLALRGGADQGTAGLGERPADLEQHPGLAASTGADDRVAATLLSGVHQTLDERGAPLAAGAVQGGPGGHPDLGSSQRHEALRYVPGIGGAIAGIGTEQLLQQVDQVG